MSAPASPLYEIDKIKQVLDEENITANQSKIVEFGEKAQSDCNNELFYVFDTADFPLTETKFTAAGLPSETFNSLRKIANDLTIGYFWQDTNADNTVLDAAQKRLVDYRERLFHQPPATTL